MRHQNDSDSSVLAGFRFSKHLSAGTAGLQKNLKALQECSNDTTIESIQLMVPFSKDLKSFLDETLNERFFRLNTIVVYNAQSGFELGVDFYNLVFTAQSSVSQEHCGTISMEHFRLDTQSYTRSKNYNSCLAHKISINKNGFIGNCPSMNSTFGHVDSTPFSAAIAGSEFQSLWKLTKDKVLVCSVCEFREICADCRAFTVDDHENGKPAKCGYNPFINLWEGEENYLPEEQCGVVYDTGKLVINESLLASINRKIWD